MSSHEVKKRKRDDVREQVERFFEFDQAELIQLTENMHNLNTETSEKVFFAYKQFIEIKILREDYDAKLFSPPPLVDHMWHAHILDTAKYGTSCQRSIGKMIHHNPRGGHDLQARNQRRHAAVIEVISTFPLDTIDPNIWDWHNLLLALSPQPNTVSSTALSTPLSSNSSSNTSQNVAPTGDIVDQNKTFTLVIRDQVGEEVFFRIKMNIRLNKVFTHYAEKKNVDVSSLRFLFNGYRILPDETTPADHGMTDGDQIDCELEQAGC
mmetsp:Transcript_19881/g.30285  ORF Transcript_19881/g.30285 Transcript_19881/m.30285 type:complete len:266 (+) Transcript_19881:197-994(+)